MDNARENTYSKQSLQELKKAVEGGDEFMIDKPIQDVFGPLKNVGGDNSRFCRQAFFGSVDAAIQLLEAVSGGICQFSIINDPTCTKATCCMWPEGLSGDIQLIGEGWDEENGSRALLTAILEALIQEESKE